MFWLESKQLSSVTAAFSLLFLSPDTASVSTASSPPNWPSAEQHLVPFIIINYAISALIISFMI